MKLAIIGSRTFDDFDVLEFFILDNFNIKEIEAIVSGGAAGADSLGALFAKKYNIKTIIFKPDWQKYGKSAGFVRNHSIINNCDIVVAAWDGFSRGTKHSVDLAKNSQKEVRILKF